MSEYEVVAVVVEAVEVELEIVEFGKNDGGIDIRARIREIDFVFQFVRKLDGTLIQPKNSGAIGVVAILDNSRFTLKTIERAITSIFPIILTDKSYIPICILNTVLDRLQEEPFTFHFLY
ncbi:19652_t:CDS:2 [Racocetra persica]|uniref:19652_t:CDS:1 n=1 Tax=Racocetra persica TaxID=160502 RepID=A0ACA9PJD0_9GLOM|nr:19652_t:CDS:2 [Racocetra persica]